MVTTRERHGENARVAFAGCTFPTDFLPSLLNIFLLHNSFHFFLFFFLCFVLSVCDDGMYRSPSFFALFAGERTGREKEREISLISLSLSLAQQSKIFSS
jgi:hypothetical protein